MTIEELNKLIKEELDAFFEAEDDDVDAGNDIEVTTDEPTAGEGDEALDTLRQIFNMLKPMVEPEEEEEEEEEMDMDDNGEEEEEEEEEMDEAVGYPNYKADQISKVKADANDVNKGLNESVEKTTEGTSNTITDRFQKLANIQK